MSALTLEPDRITSTAERTAARINERFPGSERPVPIMVRSGSPAAPHWLLQRDAIGKPTAPDAQPVDDKVVIEAVNTIEDLGSSLSRKIWQKIMLIAESR